MSLLEPPRTTNALTVLVMGTVVIVTAIEIGQTFPLVVGFASAVLFTASGRLFGGAFSYRWLVGQTLSLLASALLVLTLMGIGGLAATADSVVGVVLSTGSALALFGGTTIVMWDVVAETTADAIGRIYRGLAVACIVLASFAGGAIAFATRLGLDTVGTDPRLFDTTVLDPVIATDAGRSLLAILLVTASLYMLGSLLTHPAITELYVQLTDAIGDDPVRTTETLSAHATGRTGRQPTDGSDTKTSDPANSSEGSESPRDETDDSAATTFVQRPVSSIRSLPFIHYIPSWRTTIGAYFLAGFVLELAFFVQRVLRDPPSNFTSLESTRILRRSVADLLHVIGGSPALVRGTVALLGVLVVIQLVVRVAWRIVQRGWREYISGLTWFLIPTLIGMCVSIAAPFVFAWLRDTQSVHYVPDFQDGIRVVFAHDGGLVIEEIDVMSLSLGMRYDSAGFTDGLVFALDLIGAPGLGLVPLSAVFLTGFAVLVVGRVGVWPVVAQRSDPRAVGPFLVLFGVVVATGLGMSPGPALVATAGAFLLVQLRSLAVQHDRQFPPGAITRRGELAYTAAIAAPIVGGTLLAVLGSIPTLQRAVATLPEWRLLVGAAVTFAVVFLSLLSLSVSFE